LSDIATAQFSPQIQARINRLLELNQQGQLTRDDQLELDEFARFNHVLSMLKVRAAMRLQANQR
jgi:hypothetical protein